MNIYCETNFFLELVFSHEQSKYCEKIISICRKNQSKLIIPAYSFAEALYKLEAQRKQREDFREKLNLQLLQLTRTSQYNSSIITFSSLETFLTQNIEEEKKRFEKYRKLLAKIAKVISFEAQSINEARKIETKYNLTLQDAIIFSAVLEHLKLNKNPQNCFINRNSKDFNTNEIKAVLRKLNCKFIPSFKDGFNFISNQIK